MKRNKRKIYFAICIMIMMFSSMNALAFSESYDFKLSTGSMALTAYSDLVLKTNTEQCGYVEVGEGSDLTEDQRMWFTMFDGNHVQKGTEVGIGSLVSRKIPYDLDKAANLCYLQLRGRMGVKDVHAKGTWKP